MTSIAQSASGEPPLPAALLIRNEDVAPIFFGANQASAHWVLTNVREFLSETFIVAKTVIEEIPLPFHACHLRSDPFVVANQLRERSSSIEADEGMQVIGHKH